MKALQPMSSNHQSTLAMVTGDVVIIMKVEEDRRVCQRGCEDLARSYQGASPSHRRAVSEAGWLCRMEGKDGAVVAENAAEVLAAIARARMPPLTHVLGSSDNLQRLVGLCTRPDSSTQLTVQVDILLPDSMHSPHPTHLHLHSCKTV